MGILEHVGAARLINVQDPVPFPVHFLLLFKVLLLILPDVGHANLSTEVGEHQVLHLDGETVSVVSVASQSLS